MPLQYGHIQMRLDFMFAYNLEQECGAEKAAWFTRKKFLICEKVEMKHCISEPLDFENYLMILKALLSQSQNTFFKV